MPESSEVSVAKRTGGKLRDLGECIRLCVDFSSGGTMSALLLHEKERRGLLQKTGCPGVATLGGEEG